MPTLPTILEGPSDEERGDVVAVVSPHPKQDEKPRSLWAALFLLGFGLLLPFNIVLNAIPFFASRLGEGVIFEVAPSYTTPQLLMQPIILLFAHRIRPLNRLFAVCLGQALIMALCPFLAVQSLSWNFMLMAASGASTAVMESSLFGFASLLPSHSTGGLMAGEAMAGLLSALSQLLFNAVIPGDSETAAKWYFFTAALALAVSAYCAWRLRGNAVVIERGANEKRDPFTLLHLEDEGSGEKRSAESAEAGGGVKDYSKPSASAHFQAELQGLENPSAASISSSSSSLDEIAVPNPTAFPEPSPSSQVVPEPILTAPPVAATTTLNGKTPSSLYLAAKGWFTGIRRVLVQIWPAALAIFLNFVATFLCIPGVIASIPYRGDTQYFLDQPGDWTNVLFAVFSTFDLVGRLMTPLTPKCMLPQVSVLIYSVAKFLLVPLVVGAARGWHWLDSDIAAVLSVAAVATFNGHCVSLGMMAAPRETKEERDRELAGFVAVLFLHAGISGGSILALLLEQK